MSARSSLRRHAYGWITLVLAVTSASSHFGFAMATGATVSEWLRDVFENLTSEFVQLIWQVVGLAWFLHVGSPASKEGGDRIEAKIDMLVRRAIEDGDDRLREIDARHMRSGAA
jgi:hypothetical protein